MDNSFDTFLQNLEGEKSCGDLRQGGVAANNGQQDVQQRKSELECLEKELGIMEASLDESFIDTEEVPRLYDKAQNIVKSLEVIERHIHTQNKEIPLSSERIKKAGKNIDALAADLQSMINSHSLEFDPNIIFAPILDQAHQMKNSIIQQIANTANSFDLEGLNLQITNIVEQRKKRANLSLEIEAYRSLQQDTNNSYGIRNGELVKLRLEKEQLTLNLQKKKQTIAHWTSEAKEKQGKVDVCQEEIEAHRAAAEQVITDYQQTLQSLDTGATKLSQLSDQANLIQQQIGQLKERSSKLRGDHAAAKSSIIEKHTQSREAKQATLNSLKKRQAALTLELEETQKELNRVNALKDRLARKDAFINDFADKIAAVNEKTLDKINEIQSLNTKEENYRLESQRKFDARKSKLLQEQQEVDQKHARLEEMKDALVNVELSLLEKTEQRNKLQKELEKLNLREKTPDRVTFAPFSSSTPIMVSPSQPCILTQPIGQPTTRTTRSTARGRKANKKRLQY